MAKKFKVAIAGVNGKMGRCSMSAISKSENLEFAGAFGRAGAPYIGMDLSEFISGSNGPIGIEVSENINKCIETNKPDVLLEFTQAKSAIENAEIACKNKVHPLIGTSGLEDADFKHLEALANDSGIGIMVVPNFSIGAVLMIEFARQAGRFFDHVEVVEMHGIKKLDAPSGTAMYTAKKLESNNKSYNQREVAEAEILKGARGGVTDSGVRVHSLRLPGLISHQDVFCGSAGELLEIKHASFNTDCFLKGIELASTKIVGSTGLTVGLESLINV